MKPTQIMKELGRRWKELSDEEKAPFEQKSRLEKDDYFVQVHRIISTAIVFLQSIV